MRKAWRWMLAAAVLAPAMAGAGGCTQLFAWTVAQFTPPKRIQAVYEPPKDRKFLVLVEDRPPVAYQEIKYELASRISRKLQEEKIAASTIPYERILDLAADRNFSQLSISEVGQKLGADVVLYVQIQNFGLRDSPDSPLWQGRLATSVWLVDARNPGRLWPKDLPDQTGYAVPPLEFRHTENPSPTYGQEIAKALAEQMADRIVQLFHVHYESADLHHDEGPRQTMD